MPTRPDDVPDFAAALQSLVDEYSYFWEASSAEIVAALTAQSAVVVASRGTQTGGASSAVSETPDPPPALPETTPIQA